MSLEIRVDADEVTRALDELDKRQTKTALNKALTAAAKFLKPLVKAAAPKGPTGNLRRQVRYKRVRRPKTADVGTVVTSFARHRHLVLQGTRDRFTKGSHAFRGRMPANPFIDRVANRYEEQAIRIAEAELIRQLDLE